MPFRSLGLSSKTVQSVHDAGYETPTPIQSAAIPHILQGNDLIGIAQTGTGKTAAFVLPLIEQLAATPSIGRRIPRALILAPTRELAAQIDQAIGELSRHHRVHRVAIFGGVSERPQIDAVRRGVDVIIATPGRLLDLMARHVDLRGIRYAVFDEADRMMDMGFLPQIRKIAAALPRQRQTLLFSATLSKDIEQIANEFLRAPKIVEIGRRANPAETVAQLLYPVSRERKIDLLLHILRDRSLKLVLVFSRTKHGADKIARKLNQAGIETATLHSNRSQGQRTAALNAFRSGRVRVLVATDIAARGLDIDAISHVINFDFPPQPEDYVHRIGRTGRAEATGDAISFVTPDDEDSVRDLERMTHKKIERRKISGFDYSEKIRLQHVTPASAFSNSSRSSVSTWKPRRSSNRRVRG
jgi:ATP-dependent RNA helicase RhlE